MRTARGHRPESVCTVTDRSFLRAASGDQFLDIFRRIATYVDRILRGEKPGDLPVQFPTKFEMVLNLKTGSRMRLAK